MAIQLNSPGWRIRSRSRGASETDQTLPGLPPAFLTEDSRVAEEAILDPAPATRAQGTAAAMLDLSCDVEPGQMAVLAVRHASGALTFHAPLQITTRGVRVPAQARFQVPIRRPPAARGLAGQAIKAIVVKTAQLAGDRLASVLLPRLVEAFETRTWKKKGLKEGWLRVTKETLTTGALLPGAPVSPERSLLFIHGTFSNAAAAYRSLASSTFLDRVKEIYEDRIFAFDHFSLSRTPSENARMLLEGLPDHATTFDVVTHSRGGLVLRTLVECATEFGPLSRRFMLSRAVLVASPNEGTPLATPARWQQTFGWFANLLELFPDNPFSTAAEFVANGLVWLANHASGDVPGLHAMDALGAPITAIQDEPGPPQDAYSALVANYHPTDGLQRLLDVGLDEFFASANDLVVPSEGGWRIDRGAQFIPASRIGCFGPGGNLPDDAVTHVSFFSRPATADFILTALEGRRQPLNDVDPRNRLPDRRLSVGARRGGTSARQWTAPPSRVRPVRASRTARTASGSLLQISITNGDLMFEPEPLMLGHYASTQLTGTEQVMDTLIGGALQHALELGAYPNTVKAHEIFINKHTTGPQITTIPRPQAVIVAGLGPEGRLRPADLVRTVRLAVIGWSRHLAQTRPRARTLPPFTLATTLIGSGGTGVSAGQSARLVAQGVWEANELLRDKGEESEAGAVRQEWPRCSHLRITELYLDRATEAWRALRMQKDALPPLFDLAPLIKPGSGALSRPPDSGYRGATYDFITIETRRSESGQTAIEFTLDTRRARNEVRGKSTQSRLIRRLVETASNDQNQDRRVGRTLFNLLIPIELEPYLTGSGEMVMALDPNTAAIPWELLDVTRDRQTDQKPWAISVKLLRKLRLDKFREHVLDSDAADWTLVIGDPACPPAYPRLEGARSEAIAVNDRLVGHGGLEPSKVKLLASADPTRAGPTAEEIINTLFENDWRIVHVAGHGVPGANGAPGGVVLSSGTSLGPDEFRSMRTVPELVFVNCCYLGRGDDRQLLSLRYDRARFASGVAGALIEIGVHCVVAAGWAVDDGLAADFASAFYAAILRNERFIDAVGDARLAAYNSDPHSNTWAAYQCYGDPDWRLRPTPADAARTAGDDELSGIASAPALVLELEHIAMQSKFQEHDLPAQVNTLHRLEALFGSDLGDGGDVAEAFGWAFSESGDMQNAIRWFERAANAPDGLASMRASEKLVNSRSRFAWETVERPLRHRDEMRRRAADARLPVGARAAARQALPEANSRLARAAADARGLIEQALDLIEKLSHFNVTMERANLLGSAFKRRALVNEAAGTASSVQRDLGEMRRAYLRALRVGEREPGADLYYSASNCLIGDVALDAGAARKLRLDPELLKIVTASLAGKSGIEADFWSEVGTIELDQYRAMADRRLARVSKSLHERYRDLHKRVPSPRMWSSVYDTSFLVLGRYSGKTSKVSKAERRAAATLLDALRTLSHEEPDERPAS